MPDPIILESARGCVTFLVTSNSCTGHSFFLLSCHRVIRLMWVGMHRFLSQIVREQTHTHTHTAQALRCISLCFYCLRSRPIGPKVVC